ncbi:phosphoprotein associated with glycosphingolipid-enriched microdomains 1 isoform X2 [Protopterus annectens]|uniref:phosphoprotein associated with glycosphingolipid-enriched microdomains 1 isoform X2 n=1 Tax=Protopterus annectens TaxID=7888 RepID=UPI001CF9C47E|nr:phosphoprotein associated with glycosphingolipid-enriched microdomains 1 isoform X2 [Protopterus annectens]
MAPVDTLEVTQGLSSTEQPQVLLLGVLIAGASFLTLSILTLLCSSCHGRKKMLIVNGDHENLMNVASDKETFSFSATTSIGTDAPANSCQNGTVSNGEVLSDDSDAAYIQPYEEVLTPKCESLEQLENTGKSIRCHQSRELPSIPPNDGTEAAECTGNQQVNASVTADSTYEVVKDTSLQDNVTEDGLYETVKDMKQESGLKGNAEVSAPETKTMVCGDVPQGGVASAEYASVDHNRKSHPIINTIYVLEKSGSQDEDTPGQDEDIPPPVPLKQLDENENVQSKDIEGEGSKNVGKAQTVAAMYSTVTKSQENIDLAMPDSTYSYIKEVPLQSTPSVGSDLYSTVIDTEKTSTITGVAGPLLVQNPAENDYEAIHMEAKTESLNEPISAISPASPPQIDHDYESIADLQKHSKQ